MRTEATVAASEPLASPGPPPGPRERRGLDLHFELEEPLHDGALVEVWRATLSTGETVALKKLKPRCRIHPGAALLLRREHRLLATLGRIPGPSEGDDFRSQPRIVATLGFIERPDCCALLTEYLDGGDLVSLAGAAPRHWLNAALDVVAALEHVHARGFVHCDVKSRNVLFAGAGAGEGVAAFGRAKLIDFGSAVPIGAPLPHGGRTPAHEPRHCGFAEAYLRAGRATQALDVYALAVLLYELLAGRLPFSGPEGNRDGGEGDEGKSKSKAKDYGKGEGKGKGDGSGDIERVYLESAGLQWPLSGCLQGPRALRALAQRVVATLAAETEAGVGTLMQFRNVLESVRSEQAPGAAISRKRGFGLTIPESRPGSLGRR